MVENTIITTDRTPREQIEAALDKGVVSEAAGVPVEVSINEPMVMGFQVHVKPTGIGPLEDYEIDIEAIEAVMDELGFEPLHGGHTRHKLKFHDKDDPQGNQ